MWKAALTFGLGFFIATQFYRNIDKEEAKKKEERIKRRVQEILEDVGLTKKEAKKQSTSITSKS